ncbi:MAG: hypothetical protein WC824_02885 [Bacteroidota bacterium]|jgi:hypothetical protein
MDELDQLLLEFHGWKEETVLPMVLKAFQNLSIVDASLLRFTYFDDLSIEDISEFCAMRAEEVPSALDNAMLRITMALADVSRFKSITRERADALLKVAGNSFREHNELAFRHARVEAVTSEAPTPSFLESMAELFATTIDTFVSWAECQIARPVLATVSGAPSTETETDARNRKEIIARLTTSDNQVICIIRRDVKTDICDAYCESFNPAMHGRIVLIGAFSKKSMENDVQQVVFKQQLELHGANAPIISGYCLLGKITEDLEIRCAVKN